MLLSRRTVTGGLFGMLAVAVAVAGAGPVLAISKDQAFVLQTLPLHSTGQIKLPRVKLLSPQLPSHAPLLPSLVPK